MDSGLFHHWDRWTNWGIIKKLGLQDQKSNIGSNILNTHYTNLAKLTSIFVAGALFIGIAFIIFVGELCVPNKSSTAVELYPSLS